VAFLKAVLFDAIIGSASSGVEPSNFRRSTICACAAIHSSGSCTLTLLVPSDLLLDCLNYICNWSPADVPGASFTITVLACWVAMLWTLHWPQHLVK
jgi:hypothetical protein